MLDAPRAARALLTASAVRERSAKMLDLGLDGRLTAFSVAMDRLPAAADVVVDVIRANYPDLVIPFHARWRHFVAGGRDLGAELISAVADPAERGRTAFDLAIVSVLLDAGAGMGWRYRDGPTGAELSKSEGLAVASLRMFAAGAFAADGQSPRADAARLATITADDIAAGFQVGPDNPLVGLEGRAALLARLGQAAAGAPDVFGTADTPRPGGLFDHLAATAEDRRLPATAILAAVLAHLGPIWPSRVTLGGIALGDCWHHPLIRAGDASDGLIPFHKLSQWLSYSLIEPLESAGLTVTHVDGLTGLPEYRNGGLFVDMGVIALHDPAMATADNRVDGALVVEWRGLTVALLDAIAPLVRERLNLSVADFPLARVLEGGTWAAGRRLARERRADGGPPIRVVSDGTVF
ncbi:MAG: URC4/urg3 family protein [Phreatobacter sp.]|uniref:URC4/urg3 family protein n=1 Tax=Phreatobacter sp. TaxID=1966341 RepID=UPI002734D9B2|nr:URC4/urg3 family protein [Phreatobacter sp.]MDP2803149.1 URC4/urg3 family protein [Phreatobacter sp.]